MERSGEYGLWTRKETILARKLFIESGRISGQLLVSTTRMTCCMTGLLVSIICDLNACTICLPVLDEGVLYHTCLSCLYVWSLYMLEPVTCACYKLVTCAWFVVVWTCIQRPSYETLNRGSLVRYSRCASLLCCPAPPWTKS